MTQLIYTGAQNYETTYATVSSKDVGMLQHLWLFKRIMGIYWLKVPTILMTPPPRCIKKRPCRVTRAYINAYSCQFYYKLDQ